jgi:hypothetical protein
MAAAISSFQPEFHEDEKSEAPMRFALSAQNRLTP